MSSGSLTSCQEVVLVGDGSLVLNSWETSCIIRLEKSLDQSVFFWLWTVGLKLSEPRFPSCLTCMSTTPHKYLAMLEWLQVSLKTVGFPVMDQVMEGSVLEDRDPMGILSISKGPILSCKNAR